MNNNRKSESVCRVQTGSKTHPHVLNTMVVKVRYNDTTCSAMFYIIDPPTPTSTPSHSPIRTFFFKSIIYLLSTIYSQIVCTLIRIREKKCITNMSIFKHNSFDTKCKEVISSGVKMIFKA